MRYYFDHNATTPVSPESLEAMLPCFEHTFGNASSIHRDGQIARQKLETARRQVATFLGCGPKEIVFTSGGTESDNLAVLGVGSGHVITTSIEHPAVLSSCERVDATVVPVGGDGIVSPDDIRRAIRPDTVLISVMHANNELGTVQPVAEIARIAREAGVLMHSDGVQAAGKIPVDVKELGVDLYSISGHKLNAPKGVAALYVRDGVKISARSFGGRHERERRAGTENVPGAVALGGAVETPRLHYGALRDRLERGIIERVSDVRVNCGGSPRVPNTSNISFEGIEGESLVIALDLRGFSVSSGSACSSGAVEPSHVLTAIGLSREQGKSTLRFSLGLGNDAEQVELLIDAVGQACVHLRKWSPSKLCQIL